MGSHDGLAKPGPTCHDRKRFVLNVVNRRMDAAETEAEIRRQLAIHRPIHSVLVEDKANGPAIVERLRVNISRVIAVNPQGGKEARMFAAAPEWQAGDWYLDRNAAWAEPFVEQITMFPSGRYDDMADAMSQAAAWLVQNRSPKVVTYNFLTGRVLQEFY